MSYLSIPGDNKDFPCCGMDHAIAERSIQSMRNKQALAGMAGAPKPKGFARGGMVEPSSEPTLLDFVRARIAEDEQMASDASGHKVTIGCAWEGVAVSRHIFNWSSARVLEECRSKWMITDLIALSADHSDRMSGAYMTLQLLAAPYSAHRDYLPEWWLEDTKGYC